MPVIACPKCGAKNRVDQNKTTAMRPLCGRCQTNLKGSGERRQYV